MSAARYDAVVVGSGPNGLAAAITLAQHGCSVLVLEAKSEIGGGTRTSELTLAGYHHDVCSAVHPMAVLSPCFRKLALEGLTWVEPPIALSHPLGGEHAVSLRRSLLATARELGQDERSYFDPLSAFVRGSQGLFQDLLRPVGWPKHPILYTRFGWAAMKSAEHLATNWFTTGAARALFAGCAAHSFLSLDAPFSSAIGLSLLIAGHATGWPFPKGGAQKLAEALTRHLLALGGTVETGRRVSTWKDIPPARVVLFDTSPRALVRIGESQLSSGYRNAITRYRRAPGIFKLDWALEGPIPWAAPACAKAGCVHVGGSFEEIAASEAALSRGEHAERPFVLVTQPSLFDDTRAPPGKHTGWAYCHVPNGSTRDMTSDIEAQVERFAPGFRDRVLARHSMNTAALEQYNENYEGGDISGGSNEFPQFFARPRLALNPYETSNPAVFLCSSSTPPGGGVHGMCGFHAARAALHKVFGKNASDG